MGGVVTCGGSRLGGRCCDPLGFPVWRPGSPWRGFWFGGWGCLALAGLLAWWPGPPLAGVFGLVGGVVTCGGSRLGGRCCDSLGFPVWRPGLPCPGGASGVVAGAVTRRGFRFGGWGCDLAGFSVWWPGPSPGGAPAWWPGPQPAGVPGLAAGVALSWWGFWCGGRGRHPPGFSVWWVGLLPAGVPGLAAGVATRWGFRSGGRGRHPPEFPVWRPVLPCPAGVPGSAADAATRRGFRSGGRRRHPLGFPGWRPVLRPAGAPGLVAGAPTRRGFRSGGWGCHLRGLPAWRPTSSPAGVSGLVAGAVTRRGFRAGGPGGGLALVGCCGSVWAGARLLWWSLCVPGWWSGARARRGRSGAEPSTEGGFGLVPPVSRCSTPPMRPTPSMTGWRLPGPAAGYAGTGPESHDVRLYGGQLTVRCLPGVEVRDRRCRRAGTASRRSASR